MGRIAIARRHRTSGRSIAYWNRDEYPSLDPESANYRPNVLQRGWVLKILPGQEYVPPPDDGVLMQILRPDMYRAAQSAKIAGWD